MHWLVCMHFNILCTSTKNHFPCFAIYYCNLKSYTCHNAFALIQILFSQKSRPTYLMYIHSIWWRLNLPSNNQHSSSTIHKEIRSAHLICKHNINWKKQIFHAFYKNKNIPYEKKNDKWTNKWTTNDQIYHCHVIINICYLANMLYIWNVFVSWRCLLKTFETFHKVSNCSDIRIRIPNSSKSAKSCLAFFWGEVGW